jgi:hypothetical protein
LIAKASGSNDSKTFNWKGQKDLSSSQVGFILKKFGKGCPLCHTNEHEFTSCPVIKDKWSVSKMKKSNQSSPKVGTGRQTTADGTLQENSDTSTETTADSQGKSSTPCDYITTPETDTSLSPFTTSDQLLTILSSPTQGNRYLIETENEELDQLGSF